MMQRGGSLLRPPEQQLLILVDLFQEYVYVPRAAPSTCRVAQFDEAVFGLFEPFRGGLIVLCGLLMQMPHGNPRFRSAQLDGVVNNMRV